MIPSHLQNRSIDQLRSTQETIRCFLVEPVGEGYESVITTEEGQCVGGFNYHRSEKIIHRFGLLPDFNYDDAWVATGDKRKDLALPYCSRCGNHNFSEEAIRKSSGSKGRVWHRKDTWERADNLNDFGPGAMWYITWYSRTEISCLNCNVRFDKDTRDDFTWLMGETYTHKCGAATISQSLGYWHPHFDNVTFPDPPLCVRTPGGDWVIDSRASNCPLKEDNTHKCWPRQGTAPSITVDKAFGNTCGAGGGSIISGNYHGFLRDGFLVKC
jgi:hypothetical protein